ncbi:AEC family transporter [Salipaludibacillus sp. CF4.18]|uniref:AEC family transporter n=1 Tax=Salipaludibacillus sp. CF4.18 TaxID=3373081 RepID=UPI003EE4B899
MNDYRLILLPILGIICLLLGGGYSLIIAKALKFDRHKRGTVFLTGFYSNYGAFGTLFCYVLIGEESLAYVALFRLFEEFMYYTVGFPVAKRFSDQKSLSSKNLPQRLAEVAKDPFILIALVSVAVGSSLNVSNYSRPEFYGGLIELLLPTTILLLMIPIGYNIKFTYIKSFIKESLIISLVKFLLVPLTIISISLALDMKALNNGTVLQVIVILSMMPPAFTSVIPVRLYNLDINLANSSLIVNTVVFLLIIPIIQLLIDLF